MRPGSRDVSLVPAETMLSLEKLFLEFPPFQGDSKESVRKRVKLINISRNIQTVTFLAALEIISIKGSDNEYFRLWLAVSVLSAQFCP